MGHTDIVQWLLEQKNELVLDIHTRNHSGRTPAHLTSYRGYTAIVKLLIDHGIDVALEDVIGNTLLHLACWHRHVEVVHVLMGHKK